MIRAFQRGDEDSILAFHREAFPDHPPRTRAHFDWKFHHNPAGPTEAALAFRGERCVAFYGCSPTRCVLRGEPIVAGLQTDIAVAPDLRRGLTGGRLLIDVCKEYTRLFVAGTKSLEWGFPEPTLVSVGERHLRIRALRDVCWIVRSSNRASAPPEGIEVIQGTVTPVGVDDLWRRCASEHQLYTQRDARYLDWRYARHPDVTYSAFEAYRSGSLCGLAIVRSGGPDPRLLTIMEWLVPRGDTDVEHAMLFQLTDEARNRGLTYLGIWLPLSLPHARHLQEAHGFFAHGSPYLEYYRAWGSDSARRWLAENWFQTTGDIDFF